MYISAPNVENSEFIRSQTMPPKQNFFSASCYSSERVRTERSYRWSQPLTSLLPTPFSEEGWIDGDIFCGRPDAVRLPVCLSVCLSVLGKVIFGRRGVSRNKCLCSRRQAQTKFLAFLFFARIFDAVTLLPWFMVWLVPPFLMHSNYHLWSSALFTNQNLTLSRRVYGRKSKLEPQLSLRIQDLRNATTYVRTWKRFVRLSR